MRSAFIDQTHLHYTPLAYCAATFAEFGSLRKTAKGGLKLRSPAKRCPAGRQGCWNANTLPVPASSEPAPFFFLFSPQNSRALVIKPTAQGGSCKHRPAADGQTHQSIKGRPWRPTTEARFLSGLKLNFKHLITLIRILLTTTSTRHFSNEAESLHSG